MSAILGFLRLLYEHKEKIILGALVIAFIGVGYVQWRGKNGGDTNDPGGDKDPKTKTDPRPPDLQKIPQVGNELSLDRVLELSSGCIFCPPTKDESGEGDEEREEMWATINVKSVFDATRSGSFIAIIEVDNKRMFVKEGEQFDDYSVQRIDGVRNCLTIVKRGSKDKREFCKEN